MKTIATITAAAVVAGLAGTAAVGQTETGQTVQGPVRLVKVLEAAETSTGGRALEAELESEGGRLVYEIDVVRGSDEMHEVIVDAGTGEVVSSDEQTVQGLWARWIGSEALDALAGSERSLAEVVTATEAETGAVVREVSLDDEDGRAVYEMELIRPDGGEMELEIDALSGETLKREIDD